RQIDDTVDEQGEMDSRRPPKPRPWRSGAGEKARQSGDKRVARERRAAVEAKGAPAAKHQPPRIEAAVALRNQCPERGARPGDDRRGGRAPLVARRGCHVVYERPLDMIVAQLVRGAGPSSARDSRGKAFVRPPREAVLVAGGYRERTRRLFALRI